MKPVLVNFRWSRLSWFLMLLHSILMVLAALVVMCLPLTPSENQELKETRKDREKKDPEDNAHLDESSASVGVLEGSIR